MSHPQSRMGRNPFEKKLGKPAATAGKIDRKDTPTEDESAPPRGQRAAAESLLFRLTLGIPLSMALLGIKSLLVARYLAREFGQQIRS